MPRTIRLEANRPDDAADWFGSALHFPVHADDTGGRVSMQLAELPPGASNPPHSHGSEDELFYVLQGAVTATTPAGPTRLEQGDLILLPPGLPHQLTGDAKTGATILTLLSPGAIERAFQNVVADPSPARLKQEMTVYGVDLLDTMQPHQHPLAPNPAAPTVVRAGEGDRYWMAGDTYTIKVPGELVDNRFCLVHFDIPPGGGPMPHVHTRDEEVFHIVSGRAEFYADGTVVEGEAGQTVVLPRGLPHAFRNHTDGRTEFLCLTSPAGFDAFVRRVGQPAGAGDAPPPDAKELARLKAAAGEFGIELRPELDW